MSGKGMGCASRGGGAVTSGPQNHMMSETSKTTGPVRMAKGGLANKGGINEHKRMAMGKGIGAAKAMRKGGAC